MAKYFQDKELACRCGCGRIPRTEITEKLDALRASWGRRLNCLSGSRCEKHSEDLRARGIPAARKSKHLEGLAFDLAPVDPERMEAFRHWIKVNAERLGIWVEDYAATPSWVHVQFAPYPSWKPRMNRFFTPRG